jgi:hypothetical protein
MKKTSKSAGASPEKAKKPTVAAKKATPAPAKPKTVARQATAPKKTKSAAPAAKAVSKPTKQAAPAGGQPALATVIAKVDVGFGNQLFIRGSAAGLDWNRGTLMECRADSEWVWTGPVAETALFKVLLNDTVWSQGEDFVATPGVRLEIAPTF